MTLIHVLQPHHEPACVRIYLFSDIIVKKDFKVAERRKCKHFTHVGMLADGIVLRFNTFYFTLSLKLIALPLMLCILWLFINILAETRRQYAVIV